MSGIWAETEHLVLDRDGVLWSRYKAGWHYHGDVSAGDVPAAWAAEADELLDMWEDRADDRAEQRWSWRLGQR